MQKIKEILIATGNQGKLQEIQNYFNGLNIKFYYLKNFPNMAPVVEDGKTLEENAIKKAKETSEFTNMICLSDDTGLEVEYLNNAPGVYSARYAGENATYDDNNKKLLQELKNVKNRTATFKTIMVLYFPTKECFKVEGECKGLILDKFAGKNGFGYDPIFFVPKLNKTFAEMTLEEKNKISHRAMALKKMQQIIYSLNKD